MSGYEGLGTDLTQLGFQIKDKVFKDVGIPTCVGIAPTKTLAKYCNHLAKHYAGLKGVCNWLDLTPQRQAKAVRYYAFHDGKRTSGNVLHSTGTCKTKKTANHEKPQLQSFSLRQR